MSDIAGRIAARLLARPGRACWLDGGPTRTIVGFEPDREVEGDSLTLLDDIEAAWRRSPEQAWIGFITYDLGAAELLGRPMRRGPGPALVFRRFATALRFSATPHEVPELAGVEPLQAGAWPFGPLVPELAPAEYRTRVARAKERIRAGDTYQVNLSQAFDAHPHTNAPQESLCSRALRAYLNVRTRSPAPMGAFIVVDEGRFVLSNSPETLLEVHIGEGGEPDVARSWPIKGTRARAGDPTSDAAAARELSTSGKDAAEHVMIVDLVRNDLGRWARPGTVVAPKRPELVGLATVHHLVSEVACELRPGWSLRGLLHALFPGASITGAPKRRTAEIIDELEGEPRGIYCGAVVLLDRGLLRVSIPIRTAVVDAGGLHLRSGGGIVDDSEPELERLETVTKARAFDTLAVTNAPR